MRLKDIPLNFPAVNERQNGNGNLVTTSCGLAILNSPRWNKGTAFTEKELKELGLTPFTHGMTNVVGQINNAMLYPGLALGAIVAQSSRIRDGMFAAAANVVRQPGSSLLPHIDDLRKVSVTVAGAVAEAAVAECLARVRFVDIARQIQESMWQPEYRNIRAS